MERRFFIAISATRKSTDAEKRTLGVDEITERHTEKVMAYDRTGAAVKARTAAKKRWPEAKKWYGHTATA